MNKQLTEDHVGKLVKYVNFVHTKIGGLNGEESLQYFKDMSFIQNQLIPILKDNILEVKSVGEMPPTDAEADKPKKNKKK